MAAWQDVDGENWRDLVQRARAQGAQAGLEGAGPFENPYQRGAQVELRRHWEEMRFRVVMDMKKASASCACVRACTRACAGAV